MRPTLAVVSLALFGWTSLQADVTLRFKTEVKLNPGLPEQIVGPASKVMAASMPPESSLRFRNGKGFTDAGIYTSICDFAKQMVTLLDGKGKRYATVPAAQLVDEMVKAMPQQNAEAKAAMAAMKGHFEAKPVSRTATIQGIEAEEHDYEMTMDGPPMANDVGGPMMRMVLRFWLAKPGEVARVPAIREVAGYNLFAIATMNPLGMMEKLMPQMPGFSENIAAMAKEMQSGTGVVLKVQMENYMPMVSAMLKQHPESSPLGAGFDPDAPLMQMNKELVEISTAAIPDSVFQVPEDYKSAPVADIVQDLMTTARGAVN